MNKRTIDYLKSVEISHSFAMNYNHGVQSINTNGKWDLFEPTRFVYAFFAFNMIYAIDWESTMQQNGLKYQSRGSDNFTKIQIQSVINFVYKLENDAFETAANSLQWFWWDANEPTTGWNVKLCVHHAERNRSWAFMLTDK